jgi:hypothetical protein
MVVGHEDPQPRGSGHVGPIGNRASTVGPTSAAVSNNSRSEPDRPCTHQLSIKPDQNRRTGAHYSGVS